MSFATALSGLNAASLDLQTTGNNIANVGTTGFKRSRTEFVDVYATNLGSVTSVAPGSGVRVSEVAQQFAQGNVEFTDNSLDLAINGGGFFALAENASENVPTSFTRAGGFQVDQDGYVVNDTGQFLMAFAPNGTTVAEGFSQGVFDTLQIDTSQGLPIATNQVGVQFNLDSSEAIPVTSPFDVSDGASFNGSTSLTVYDSQGNTHIATTYFVLTGPNTWDAHQFIDGAALTPTPIALEFNTSGNLISVNGDTSTTRIAYDPFDFSTIDPNLNVDPVTLEYDFIGSTQFSSAFSVNNLTQDGLPTGNLIGLDINDEGIVLARYSNGGSRPLGQVALADFPNLQGLSKLGDTRWGQSTNSGIPIYGTAGSNTLGGIQSGALEASNVDLAEQLVQLIVAQQRYQANAEVISTQDSVTQTILQIR